MRLRQPSGQVNLIVIAAVVVLLLAGTIGVVMRGGGGANGGGSGRADIVAVKRGGFDITIPVTGELAAKDQIEIRNQLDRNAIITEIVPEGTWVKAGDVLMRLNDEEMRNKVRDALDEVNVAEAQLVQAQSEYDVLLKEQDSELAKAGLAVELSQLALKAWEEGEDVTRRQSLDLALETAQKEYERLEARFKESEGLLEQKFISLDEYRRDEIAMIQARATLTQAQRDIEVYEKYHYLQDKKKKESDLEQAKAELERTRERYIARVRRAETDVESKKFQLESKRDRLAQFESQLKFCEVKAPSSGLVVYYTSLQSNGWGRNEDPPQVGTQLYANQTVIVLPDTSSMIAVVKISEALSGLIKSGQRASVISDAQPDTPMTGEVVNVGVLAQSGGWRDPNRRDYSVRIALDGGNSMGLKPSMRCKAEIHVGRVSNALHVPVQSVFRHGPMTYVYVPDRSGFSQRKISTGQMSELFVEVTDGVNEGDKVLMREPEASEIVARIAMPKLDRKRGAPEQPGSDESVAREDESQSSETYEDHADSAESNEMKTGAATDESAQPTAKSS